jgi:HNH endonuclease
VTYGRRWGTLAKRVIARDGGRCQIRSPRCTTVATCADHFVPWEQGGARWNESNLRAACRACNMFRTTVAGKAWERGRSPAPADPMRGRCPHVLENNKWCFEGAPGGGPLDGHHARRWPMPDTWLEMVAKYEPAEAARIRRKLAEEAGAVGPGEIGVIA